MELFERRFVVMWHRVSSLLYKRTVMEADRSDKGASVASRPRSRAAGQPGKQLLWIGIENVRSRLEWRNQDLPVVFVRGDPRRQGNLAHGQRAFLAARRRGRREQGIELCLVENEESATRVLPVEQHDDQIVETREISVDSKLCRPVDSLDLDALGAATRENGHIPAFLRGAVRQVGLDVAFQQFAEDEIFPDRG